MKNLFKEVPENFFKIYTSINKEIYIESLLMIYKYYCENSYLLSKDECLGLLDDYLDNKAIDIVEEEENSLFELETKKSLMIFNKLIKYGWLKKQEDIENLKTNVTMPDYASIMLDAIEKIIIPNDSETDIYIHNIFANLMALTYAPIANFDMLDTARKNADKLNKLLQSMLLSMDKYYEQLLNQISVIDILNEHLRGYITDNVAKRYHRLKTDDNLYRYRMEIMSMISIIKNNEEKKNVMMEQLISRGHCKDNCEAYNKIEDTLETIELLLGEMEQKIKNIDIESSKYISTTVSRINYLSNRDNNLKGNLISLLQRISQDREDKTYLITSMTHMIKHTGLSDSSIYMPKRKAEKFEDTVKYIDIKEPEMSRDDILSNTLSKQKYKQSEVEDFIVGLMKDNVLDLEDISLDEEDNFYKTIIAYKLGLEKNCKFKSIVNENEYVSNDKFKINKIRFVLVEKGDK